MNPSMPQRAEIDEISARLCPLHSRRNLKGATNDKN